MKYADECCTCIECDGGYEFIGQCAITAAPYSVFVPGPELLAYRQGKSIQEAMPSVCSQDREFLMSGIAPAGFRRRSSDERTFFRSVITVEILSEDPIPNGLNLTEIDSEITCGALWSGRVTETLLNDQIDSAKMASLLNAQGNDPGLFGLDNEGHDINE
jgi:hypothetical protein